MNLQPLIISAPFGNYLTWPGATSTLGTFTWKRRGGMAYRAWRVVRTLRYSRRLQGWQNKLALPNPGISAIHRRPLKDLHGKIISVIGFSAAEWYNLLGETWPYAKRGGVIELNLSCPNVDHAMYLELLKDVKYALRPSYESDVGEHIIAKLPPMRYMELAYPLYHECGVRTFHCCNTLWTPGGGLSGPVLQQLSLVAVEAVRGTLGSDVRIIGGGGISTADDIARYVNAGANYVAVASALLNPLRYRKRQRHLQEAAALLVPRSN